MATFSWRSTLGSTKEVLWNLVLIAVGSMLCATGINGILIPQQFLSGGVTGIALVIRYLVPSLPVAMLYFILNIPIYALGWMYVGRRFFLYSIAGLLIFSGALICPNVLLPVHDKILSVLLAGIIIGVGWNHFEVIGLSRGAGYPLDYPYETFLYPPGLQCPCLQRSCPGSRSRSVLP